VLVNICCFDILVVVGWSVELFCWWINERVHVNGGAVDIEIEDV
jgi:hypothetical protein